MNLQPVIITNMTFAQILIITFSQSVNLFKFAHSYIQSFKLSNCIQRLKFIFSSSLSSSPQCLPPYYIHISTSTGSFGPRVDSFPISTALPSQLASLRYRRKPSTVRLAIEQVICIPSLSSHLLLTVSPYYIHISTSTGSFDPRVDSFPISTTLQI